MSRNFWQTVVLHLVYGWCELQEFKTKMLVAVTCWGGGRILPHSSGYLELIKKKKISSI